MSEQKLIQDLINECSITAKNHGFWDKIPVDNPLGLPTRIALVHSELTEALEAYRDENFLSLTEELADAVIRIFDICGAYDLPFYPIFISKMEKNKKRPYLHNRKVF